MIRQTTNLESSNDCSSNCNNADSCPASGSESFKTSSNGSQDIRLNNSVSLSFCSSNSVSSEANLEKSRSFDANEANFKRVFSPSKPHKGNDLRWDAIQSVKCSRNEDLGLGHFRLLKKLGCGDIGSVYLAELREMGCFFAMKVMDKGMLIGRKKLVRAQTEREILGLLDHPFLPTLYSHFETEKFSCLLMEFCSGGDLHILRQKQPGKHFSEQAASFVSPTLIQSTSQPSCHITSYCIQPSCIVDSSCKLPVACIQPSCFKPRFLNNKPRKTKTEKSGSDSLPMLIAEPTDARSMSFVGTHEYLAPEIIRGDGHGSSVDWWTFGIFLYELLTGKTPFKGNGNRETLFNVVGQPLKFPEGSISFAAKDLIRGLLAKDPKKRLGFKKGATEIKQHPFFDNVNWALIRSTNPPEIPKPIDLSILNETLKSSVQQQQQDKHSKQSDSSSGPYLDFEFF
ncbi:unnamed protein product [Thlaspi arvense]|uniref:non-specific serine/threonine protein kinase n=1 Tax=Thlaspi arvense TaxID=13288 RepID=A0AAU9TD65_THLAR|nr:unnamed protein product [Thlaspi arvense]